MVVGVLVPCPMESFNSDGGHVDSVLVVYVGL